MISKTHLEAKLAALVGQRDQLAANLNAVTGAIEFAKNLIAECDASTPKPPANKPPSTPKRKS